MISYVDQNRDAPEPENTVFQEITGGVDPIVLGKRKMPARAYVATFNFKGPDQEKRVGKLSGGERNRVHLAKLLKSGGNLLLLDEPTNDLDVDMLRALEEALVDFAGCAVVISHDRWFLDRIATHILAFEGDSRVVWCDGNYQAYELQRHERLGTRRRPAAPDQVQVAHTLTAGTAAIWGPGHVAEGDTSHDCCSSAPDSHCDRCLRNSPDRMVRVCSLACPGDHHQSESRVRRRDLESSDRGDESRLALCDDRAQPLAGLLRCRADRRIAAPGTCHADLPARCIKHRTGTATAKGEAMGERGADFTLVRLPRLGPVPRRYSRLLLLDSDVAGGAVRA